MNSIDQLPQQMRSLRLNSMAEQLATLITQGEANELSYLQFSDSLICQEMTARN